MQKKTFVYILIFSLTLTLISILLIPKNRFKNYIIEEQRSGRYSDYLTVYFNDLDNDGVLETIDYIRQKIPGNSINIKHSTTTIDLYNLSKNEVFISDYLTLADIDKNNQNEMYFISGKDSVAYLNILEFNKNNNNKIENKKIAIDSFSYLNGEPDAVNRNIKFLGNNIVFEIQAGFAIYPRNIYIYNTQNKTLKKTDTTSIVCNYFNVFFYKAKKYILPTNISASGNTISVKEYEELKESTSPDSIEIYNRKKNRVFKYGDFSSYILLYNEDLKFEFEPIEYTGWTNYTFSNHFKKDGELYLLSLTNNVSDTINKSYLTICNTKGEIVKQLNLKDSYNSLLSDTTNDYMLLRNAKTSEFSIYTKELEYKNKVQNVTHIIGYKDINNNGENELIALNKNKIIVFSNNLKRRTEFELLNDNGAVRSATLKTYTLKGKTYLYFLTKDNYYILEYKKNKYFFVKYLLFVVIWLFWFVVLYLFLKINTKRLEADNLRLEKTVAKRTEELEENNKVLFFQKEEIKTQADELLEKNEYLLELTNFKKNMTDTIIHDLKNPLNIILNKTNDKQVVSSAKRMLNLVLNILDVERYEATELVLNKEWFCIKNVLENIISELEVVCAKKNISIKIPSVKYEIFADKNILIRVFENLLTNAIKFAEPNSEIQIKAKPEAEDKIKISVFNNGETIPEQNLKSIFNKYSQVKTQNKTDHKSTGIGLAYCKMAINAHESEITVENIDNKGVVFSFWIIGKQARENADPPDITCKFEFSAEDIEIINKYKPLLQSVDFYNASKIFEILKQIPDGNKSITNWKDKIKSSVFSGNKPHFMQLIDANKD